jgi:carbonic anhydrase
MGNFYSYEGSFTTPGCDETAAFIVVQEAQNATAAQIDAIANYFSGDAYLDGNAREVQVIGDRTIYMKSRPEKSGAMTLGVAAGALVASLASLF